MNQTYTLYTCGARGTRSMAGKCYDEFGGLTTCYVLKCQQHAIIVDCGTGLYLAQDILKDCTRIDVLLTHLHYDHILGLLDWAAFPAEADVNFYGTFQNWGVKSVAHLFNQPFWPVSRELGGTINVTHGVPISLGELAEVVYHVSTHPSNGNILRINMAGNMSVTFAFDYEHLGPFPMDFAAGSNVLIYDGSYDDGEYLAYKGWGHSTWQEGCKVGKALGVQRTMISHHKPENHDDKLLQWEQEAQANYGNVFFARSGDELVLRSEEL